MIATPSPTLGSSRVNLSLWTLFLGAFVVGSAELVVVGILNLISGDLEVSVSTAGTLVTAYALGISIGGPALTAVTIKFGRRALLWASLGAYVAGNVLAGLAASFGVLLLARILTGALHGLFIGVAFAVAASIVSPERIGRAISMVFGGISVSTALGVPLGTLLGQEVAWQASFLAIAAFGLVAFIATLALIPPVPNAGGGGFGAQARYALAPRVLAVLGLGFFIMGGQFAVLTYLSPFLEKVTHISGGMISLFLLVYGVANAIGTFGGGWAADRNATRTLILANIVLIVAIAGLYVGGASPAVVTIALLVWGLVGFGLVPSLQYRVVSLAGPGQDLAAALPASAVTAGIAVGALAGGWAVSAHGPSAAVLTGLVICVVALPLSWLTSFLKPPVTSVAPQPSEETAAEAARLLADI